MAHTNRRGQIMIRQRVKLIGALVAKHLATISTMMLAQAIAKLFVAALTMGDYVIGHPRGQLVVRLVYFVPTAAYAVVAERVRVALVLFGLAVVDQVFIVDELVLLMVLPSRVAYELVEKPFAFGHLFFQIRYFFLKM